MTLPPFWHLADFGSKIDVWAQEQAATDDVVNIVVNWTFSRYDDPYQGVKREPGFPNYWWGPVPGTIVGNTVVCCYYWIYDLERRIRCDQFATLSLPL